MIFAALLLCFSGLAVYRHYLLIKEPYPLELREGASLFTTQLLVEGQNPYSLEHMPVAVNVYGICYSLVVYPFAKIWGPTLLVHRAVTGVFIILSCLFLAFVMKRKNIPGWYIFSAVIVFYLSLLFFTTPISRPDGFGVFVFLVSVFSPSLFGYSKKSLLLSILCGVLGFYTKPYFVLSLGYVAFYLFVFVSKKKGLFYSVAAGFSLLFSCVIVDLLFETYFLHIFFNNKNIAGNSLDYATRQLSVFFHIFWVPGLIALVGMFISVGAIKHEGAHFLQKIDLLKFNRPLLAINFPFSLACFFLSCVLIYWKLGRHSGSYMVYLLHLILPFFLLFAYSFTKSSKIPFFVLMPLVIYLVYRVYVFAFPFPPSRHCHQEWEKLSQFITSHTNILHTPMVTPLLIQEQKNIYDSGLTQFFPFSYHSEGIFDLFLPSNQRMKHIWTEYNESINERVRHQKFDLLVLPSTLISTAITPYYEYLETITACSFLRPDWQQGEVTLWEPKALPLETNARQAATFQLTKDSMRRLRDEGIPEDLVNALKPLKWKEFTLNDLLENVEKCLGPKHAAQYQQQILKYARHE